MKETRFLVARELRATGSGKEKRIEGYACTWNNQTDIGQFDEIISPKPFSSLDTDSVVMNFNHDDSMLLGRAGVNLKLEQDEVGLRFDCTLNDSTIARDVYENIQSGILSECSFAFTVKPDGEVWSAQPNGRMLRTLKNLQLWDASIVTVPAYAGTSAQARNVVAADIQQRMADANLTAETAARRAKAQAILNDHEAWKANQVSAEMADIERLRTRRDNLFN
ncbi:MAG TPA: HK97 family phage prohead protease [Candidatus Sulfotelmatobacter sp.]|jgi:HK97 family phage prohead protease|nr:HK97 family phage prohead protease [Candidatus Sulfotelmatobacter sp.]